MEKKMALEHTPSSLEVSILKPSMRKKGGLITMPFIIANEAFEKVASYGLIQNMIFYLMKSYGIGVAKGANILFLWSAATNFMPLVGALIADAFLGRFLTICLGCISSLSGSILLWLTAMIPKVRPPPCDFTAKSCKSASSGQLTMLLSSFALMSIGAGGIRPCSLAFGADQLDDKANPNNERVLESFFGWYYASASAAVLVAFTGIVYIQDHMGWKVGFGVPAILMLLSGLLFVLASPFYLTQKGSRNLLTGFFQVPIAAFRNRSSSISSQHDFYHTKRNSHQTRPSSRLRFLNKACIIRNEEDEVASDGTSKNPWRLCTVSQVEELKALIRVIPIWSSCIMLSINTSQNTFPVLQASSMDRRLTSSFKIPAASCAMFTIISLGLWIVLYDRVILPFASKIRGKPVQIGVKLRIGIGLLLSFLAMVVSGTVENIRRRRAISEGYINNPAAVVKMSAMWLIPQYCLHGLAEAFNAIGQTEFYYSEFPKSMSAIAACLNGLGMAVANLLASVIVHYVDKYTSSGGRESWVSDNINKGRFDSYYWLLAVMSLINLPFFLLCSWLYGPCKQQEESISREEIELNEN